MTTIKCTKCEKLYDEEGKAIPILYEEEKAISTAFSKAKSILKRWGFSLTKIIVKSYSLRYNLATVSYCPYCYQEHHHCPRCHTVVPASLFNTS